MLNTVEQCLKPVSTQPNQVKLCHLCVSTVSFTCPKSTITYQNNGGYQRRINNPVEHLRWSTFEKIVNN